MLTLFVALAIQACPQRIDVLVPSARSTAATLTMSECGKRVFGPWRARVGRNGVSARHREGDGTTPAGRFGFGPVVYGLDSDPGVHLRYHRLVCGDWWDEDPRSPSYNRFRHVGCGSAPPFRGGSEPGWGAPPPVARGRGAVVADQPRLQAVRIHPLQRRAGGTRPRVGDLPARRH